MRVFAITFLVAVIAGCASAPSPEMAELNRYREQVRPNAGASVKWSEYYRGLYDRMAAAGAPGSLLNLGADAIGYAKQYEAGQMSSDEFEDKRRRLTAAQASLGAQERANAQEAHQRAQVASAATLAAAAQMMQASAPVPIPQQAASFRQVAPPGVAGVMGHLQSQSINGMLKYCRYSNGVVSTINATDICNINIQ